MKGFHLAVSRACVLCLVFASGVAIADRVKRPMHVHKVHELALEIWTEAHPEWDTRVERQNGQPIFIAETPAHTYPPAGMSWASVPWLKFTAQEFHEGAKGAIHQAARNYGVKAPATIELKAVKYGGLTGYEAVFSAKAHDSLIDVRVFCGHRPGRAAVVMQAFTHKGKLGHISEQIRRSWTNLRYLE